MIVHLSGAPGSGKTTIAQNVSKPRWTIYDLDDLNRNFVEGNNLVPLTRLNPSKVVQLYQKHIDQLVTSARQEGNHILFVGINAGLLGSPVGTNLIRLHADHHILLDVDSDLNAQRWIQRDMPEVLDGFMASLKDDVLNNYNKLKTQEAKLVKQYKKDFSDIMRDFRPSQRKDDIQQFKKFYLKQGYKRLSPDVFVEWFTGL